MYPSVSTSSQKEGTTCVCNGESGKTMLHFASDLKRSWAGKRTPTHRKEYGYEIVHSRYIWQWRMFCVAYHCLWNFPAFSNAYSSRLQNTTGTSRIFVRHSDVRRQYKASTCTCSIPRIHKNQSLFERWLKNVEIVSVSMLTPSKSGADFGHAHSFCWW